ncbi:hypothetical protein GOBAR_AA04468 [Gossypium barbadense]|uniref:Transposase MuDR plant domain-containing protein n=1 Tax=Gossypium barbadense TaxID=3634 RepID=A0A2P5YKF5_GOSBA|nr:hypothetical protein GOBAR_AA04468 [Gossypium barbadense]
MELVNDEDVETMIAIYCRNRSNQNTSIQLFTELAGVEPTEDLTALGKEHGAQEPCKVAPILYVDSGSTIRGIDINRNVATNIDVVGDDGYDSSNPCDHEVDSDSDPDADKVHDDINEEDVNDDDNINVSSVGNQIQHPDAAHVAEFSEYLEILPAHRLALDFDLEEVLIGQRFESKEDCIFTIKSYSMNISVG